MLEGERSYQRGQENLVPSNNASSIPESQVIPKAQEKPWYIRHFIKLLISFGLGGAAAALILSWVLWLHCGMSSGSSDQLRLHLLYVTGGIIAVLTLLQTNWKNQGDRLKIDADIKKNEQDAEKNERDHIRQVHAERRSRYTKAVEQLANEKAAVRLGGVYTLVGLVDEWLTDGTFSPEERQKEGQVIINNLCSYIRSPFPLALKAETLEADSEPDNYEGDFSKDQATFHEEQDVRRTIFVEICKRSSDMEEVGKVIETFPGTWSDFDFDFSRASIFYPLSNLTIEKGNFSSAKFYGEANFYKVFFTQEAHFDQAEFAQKSNFNEAVFIQKANFEGAAFTDNASFISATFNQNANFFGSTFKQKAYFIGTFFAQNTDFMGSVFVQNTTFLRTTFAQNAHFEGAAFIQNVDFTRTSFAQNADFLRATFSMDTNFNEATFFQKANFTWATFEESSPHFVHADGEPGEAYQALFAALPAGQDVHNFTVHEDSQPIPLGTAKLDGMCCSIPVGTVLFDPASWDERQEKYTRLSEPAQ